MATKHDLGYYDQMISEHSREIYKLKNKYFTPKDYLIIIFLLIRSYHRSKE